MRNFLLDKVTDRSRLRYEHAEREEFIMKRGIGYTRISVDDDSSISLDYQDATVRESAERHRVNLLRIETDNGISGKTIKNRPAVQRVLQAVDAKEVDCVIVYRSDRMSRDGLESLQIEALMRSRGVEYLSVTEGCLTNNSVDDEFLGFIRAGLNQRERKVIALRTKAALQRKIQKGEPLGRARYGWKYDEGRLVEVPEEQRALARMRDLQSQGFSTREIVKALSNEGYRTRKGTTFTQTQVVRILRAA